jgi:hypothetical protein
VRSKRIGAGKSLVSRQTPITLKQEIATLLESGNVGSHLLTLDDKDIVFLLKAAIEQEGSMSAFSRRYGLQRAVLSQVINGKRAVSSPLAKALGLRKVYTPQRDNE